MRPDLSSLMDGARRIQEEYKKAGEELKKMMVTGESGAGLVKVTMNGQHDVKEVKLEDELLTQPKEIIEDLFAAAINNAVQRVSANTKGKFSQLNSLFNIPKNLNL